MWKLASKAAGVLGYCIQYGCLTHCTFEYIGDFVVCVGPSMEPTLYTNNILVTDRISPRLNNINRGDIIIAKSPTNPQQHICKRVVGLPGDRIMTNASFNLNPLSNSYTIHTKVLNKDTLNIVEAKSPQMDQHDEPNAPGEQKMVIVPRGHLWIEGDNVQNSSDSRNYGPVPLGLVRSRAVCRLWPLTDFKVLTNS